MGEPVLGKDSMEGIPPCNACTREAGADFGKVVGIHLLPVLVKLLQWEKPEVPESRHVKAGVRPISPTLHEGSGYLVRDLSPLSLLCCLLYLPDTPAPQAMSETACGGALVL